MRFLITFIILFFIIFMAAIVALETKACNEEYVNTNSRQIILNNDLSLEQQNRINNVNIEQELLNRRLERLEEEVRRDNYEINY